MPKRNRYPESVLTQVKSTQQPRHEGQEKPFTSRAAWPTGMVRRRNLRPCVPGNTAFPLWLLLGPMSPEASDPILGERQQFLEVLTTFAPSGSAERVCPAAPVLCERPELEQAAGTVCVWKALGPHLRLQTGCPGPVAVAPVLGAAQTYP